MPKNPPIEPADRFRKGFTLVELLTTIAVIIIISGMAFANFKQGGRRVALDMQANQLAQDLRRTQEWALAAHMVNGVTVDGYGVYLKPGENSYTIYLDNGNDNSSIHPGNGRYDENFDTPLEIITLDKNIEIASAAACLSAGVCDPVDWASVEYMIPDPTTKINGGDDIGIAEITFKIKDSSMTSKVTANKAGLVYVE